MSIGAVVAQLRADFPDITLSKVRYLETEGLVCPERSASGYRRFYAADVERLRFVLSAQRDQYLPLKVIRELVDRGETTAAPAAPALEVIASPGDPEPVIAPDARLSPSELAQVAAVEESFLTTLDGVGLIARDPAGLYHPATAAVVRSARELVDLGADLRMLKAFLPAAHREAGHASTVAAGAPRAQRAQRHDAVLKAMGNFHVALLAATASQDEAH